MHLKMFEESLLVIEQKDLLEDTFLTHITPYVLECVQSQ